jgi:phosphate starvation-inducible protein PhoH and related proteins
MRNRKKNTAPTTPGFKLSYIRPLNENQANVLGSDKNLVLSGYAGTGKSFLASYVAYKEIFDGEYNKLVYMRSAVPTRNIGFLPGTDKEKLEVYEAPYIDIATELLGRGDAYEILKKKGLVHFTSTSFVRGINLRDAVIVVDETQNMSYHELDSIITRLNDNCKIIFCGDIRQADLYKNGLEDFYNVLKVMDEFDFIEFQKEDIVRSELVKNYIVKKEEVLNRF